jgi:lipopolysaccharide cholinephosphotransferase
MNQLSEHQQLLLKVYKEFAQFCSHNNLAFFAAYGTMIGAIRHHGLIPWDDDIDVFMLRKDYDRFVELRNTLPEDGKYKISVYLDGKSPYPFAKFYTTDGTIWEYKQFPFIIGPWIDIFPIDEGDMEDEKANKALERFHYTMWKYRKAVAYASWSEIAQDFLHLNVMDGAMSLVKKIRYAPFKQKYIKEIESRLDVIRAIKGNTLRCYSTALTNEVFEKAWFEKAVNVPFEDTAIPVPNGYHEFLTALYGDYMKLPPVEKRVNHPGYFIDLKHTLTREQILKEHKELLVEKSPMSFRVLWDEIIHRAKGWQRPRPKKKE